MKPTAIILAFSAVFLTACESTTQSTSGQSYLAKYAEARTNSSGNTASHSEAAPFETALKQVAAVEPTLRFPARIGLARIENGNLTTIPTNEADSWIELADNLGPGFGEFVPVSPIVAEMVTQSISQKKIFSGYDVINKIRLGAARQHLDAVFIYEAYAKSRSQNNILRIADLTIIGGFLLPSRYMEADGYAQGILIDVLQGYPYGTLSTALEKAETSFSTRSRKDRTSAKLSDSAKAQTVAQLAQEAKELLLTLRLELAEK